MNKPSIRRTHLGHFVFVILFATLVFSAQGCAKSTCPSGRQKLGNRCCVEVSTFFFDKDGDGYGENVSVPVKNCRDTAPQGYVTESGDCNDDDPAIHVGVQELCDEVDNDCDGKVNESLVPPVAGLTEGVCVGAKKICREEMGWQDPNYNNLENYEVIELSCDEIDNDCDGIVDEAMPMDDLNHCGACSRTCAELEPGTDMCMEGQCRLSCESGLDCMANQVCDGAMGYCVPVEKVFLKATIPAEGDGFGYSVAVDGNYLVVGAPFEEDGIENSGAAYVFERDDESGVWRQTAYLKASNPGVNDRLGISVAINENYFVVGAASEDGVAENSGAAYVFERDDESGVWRQTAYLKASNPGEGDSFGVSVSIDANLLAVGAYQENGVAENSGAAYVFERDDESGVWRQTAYLKASNPGGGDNFGNSVSLHESYLVVGAPLEDGGADNSGAVYVFERDDESGVWRQTAYLKASNPVGFDFFSSSLAMNEHYIVIGALGEDGVAENSGAAYVFERDDESGVWRQTAYLKARNAGRGDYFGFSVALDGNYLVVGASREDGDASSGSMVDSANEDASDAGAVYVFENTRNGDWSQTAYFKASNAGAEDSFGTSVALDGNDLVVGAQYEDGDANSTAETPNDNAQNAGAVYLYSF